MGDRVAVMRKGELQQVDDPQTLYDRPVNLFVGGFIGSPAMNMLDATIEQRTAARRPTIGEQRSTLGAETLQQRPALAALRRPQGRPRDPPRGPRGRRARDRRAGRATARAARLELREALGSEIMAHFAIEAAPRGDRRDARARRRTSATEPRDRPSDAGERGDDRRPVRRPLPRRARASRSTAVVDTRALAFLRSRDRASGSTTRPRKEHHRENDTGTRGAVLAAHARRSRAALRQRQEGAQRASASTTRLDDGQAVSGNRHVRRRLDAAPRRRVPAVITAFNKVYPKRQDQVQARSATTCRPCSSTAIAGGNPPDMADIAQPGLVQQLVEQGQAEADHLRQGDDRAELRARVASSSGTFNGKLYALVFKACQQVARLVQRARFQGGRRHAAEDVDAAADGREDAQGVRDPAVLDRRLGRLDAHRPVREHLPAHVRARRSTTS